MGSQDKNSVETGIVWQQAILPETSTIEQAIRNLNDVGIKIVLVVDKAN
tara:strand:- start:1146 stop:1292 length:147 start_codon:yes stop_codon:yes gene_type:complete